MGAERCSGLTMKSIKVLSGRNVSKKAYSLVMHSSLTFEHGVGDADNTIEAMRHGFRMLRKYKNNIDDLLEGSVAKETLRLAR
jgi:hypothetical protein